jgi:hypothetical protein
MTQDEARQLITQLLGTGNPITLHPFEYGWIARRVLSDEQKAQGTHIGQATYIIEQTGIVTIHPSLPPTTIMNRYIQARREGRTTGRQVWPEPTTTIPDPTR